jgi:hypothetical protein
MVQVPLLPSRQIRVHESEVRSTDGLGSQASILSEASVICSCLFRLGLRGFCLLLWRGGVGCGGGRAYILPTINYTIVRLRALQVSTLNTLHDRPSLIVVQRPTPHSSFPRSCLCSTCISNNLDHDKEHHATNPPSPH